MECQQPGGAAGPQTGGYSHVPVKEENYGEPTGGRVHHFKVKFSPNDSRVYNVDCNQPCTVLEAIQKKQKYKELNCPEKNLFIKRGKADDCIVATHFPSSCVTRGEVLTISCVSQTVEEAKKQPDTAIHSRDQYSVFYIRTVGGTNTKSKKPFKNNAVENFTYLCVYGKKGTTVEEALKRDGRFSDEVTDCDFTLSDNENPKCLTECTDNVDNLNGKKFKIRLPREKRANDKKQQANTGASDNPQKKRLTSSTSVPNVVHQSGISVRAAVEKSGNSDDTDKIMEILRDQFPALKEQMQSRLRDNSYQEAVELRKEDFGKIQQSFSEVHRLRKLLKLGESVCKVIVKDVSQGTGFVLFDNFILTNAHLFKDCVKGERLKEGVEVSVLFNYDDPEPDTNYCCFKVAKSYICPEDDLDYAILELNTEGHRVSNLKTQTHKKIKIPPGLLKDFGPMPQSGEACLIGHPRGEVKKMDPTCIIEIKKRVQAVHDHLHPYKDTLFIVHIINQLNQQGIENIMIGGKLAERRATYNTFMYHGSSGCPVFDARCKVFGLHTGGYIYRQKPTESVIEYAQPLCTILKHIMETKGNEELLKKRLKKAAKGNSDLQEVLKSVSEAQVDKAEPADDGNWSDSSEPMDTDEVFRESSDEC